MSDDISTLNHSNILSIREESDGDNKQLSVGVRKGNASFTVWANGKRAASFPINGVTMAIIREVLNTVKLGESKLERFPITQRKYDGDSRQYNPICQLAICVDMENERPRIILEIAANKERFRFPITIPKSYDIEGCEFSKRQMLSISMDQLSSALATEIPTGKRLSAWPYKKDGGNRGGGGNYNRGGNSGGGNYNRGGGSSRNDDMDSEEIPF